MERKFCRLPLPSAARHGCLYVLNYFQLLCVSHYLSSDKYQVLLYNVEAPAMTRYKRFLSKYPGAKHGVSLEEFIKLDDHVSFSRATDHALKVISTF